MKNQSEANIRPPIDSEITRIVDYVHDYSPDEKALSAASLCLMDSIGCALMAKQYPACVRHLGPIVADASLANGARVIGCDFYLDPVKAAFDNGTLIRWLDFNDTWLAAEWGHPSDNLGAIWAVADYLSQRSANKAPLIADVLAMMVKAHEIQGILALANSFNSVGLDHVALVKVASSAVAAALLGANREQTAAAVSHAFADGQSLRTYRHAPNTGSRKSWAAGDATSRAVRLALIALSGEAAIPGALSAKKWGLYDVSFGGKPFVLERNYNSYVMENILFKVSFPAEFHAQTAVECAIQLHPQVVSRLDEITRIHIDTQESAVRIISKSGKLYNPADRDHCIQYMTAIGLIFGELRAEHYEDTTANDPIIDKIREKMEVTENPQYSRDYLDSEKRSIANAVQVFFADGSATEKIIVEYPLGHRNRRAESIPFLHAKFDMAMEPVFSAAKQAEIKNLFSDDARLMKTPMRDFAALMTAT